MLTDKEKRDVLLDIRFPFERKILREARKAAQMRRLRESTPDPTARNAKSRRTPRDPKEKVAKATVAAYEKELKALSSDELDDLLRARHRLPDSMRMRANVWPESAPR